MCLQTQIYQYPSLLSRHNHNIHEHLIHRTLIKLRILVVVAIKPWFFHPKGFSSNKLDLSQEYEQVPRLHQPTPNTSHPHPQLSK